MKIAIYTHSNGDSEIICKVTDFMEEHKDYVRVSGILDVEFPDHEASEYSRLVIEREKLRQQAIVRNEETDKLWAKMNAVTAKIEKIEAMRGA